LLAPLPPGSGRVSALFVLSPPPPCRGPAARRCRARGPRAGRRGPRFPSCCPRTASPSPLGSSPAGRTSCARGWMGPSCPGSYGGGGSGFRPPPSSQGEGPSRYGERSIHRCPRPARQQTLTELWPHVEAVLGHQTAPGPRPSIQRHPCRGGGSEWCYHFGPLTRHGPWTSSLNARRAWLKHPSTRRTPGASGLPHGKKDQ